MKRSKQASWLRLGLDSMKLAMEAQQVIALRLQHLAGGGASAQREAARMVTEKVAALAECQRILLGSTVRGSTKAGARQVVGLYRRKVRVNRRRLARLG